MVVATIVVVDGLVLPSRTCAAIAEMFVVLRVPFTPPTPIPTCTQNTKNQCYTTAINTSITPPHSTPHTCALGSNYSVQSPSWCRCT